MPEGQVRQLLDTLKENLNNAQNTTQAITFSGGCAALSMVLEESE
jgi:hypothetical protein